MSENFQFGQKIPITKKTNFYEYQFEIDPTLSLEERIDKLRKKGKDAELEFKQKYSDLSKWLEDYDQLYILSFCFRYFMLSNSGYDEEAEKGSLDFPPNYIELLQAFALTMPPTDSGKPLYDQLKPFKTSIKNVGELINLKLFNFPENMNSIDEINAHQLKTQMMVHTTSVRNWSYEHLMAKVTLDLTAGIDIVYEKEFGYKLTDLVKLLYRITDEVESRINKHIKKVSAFFIKKKPLEIINTYEKVFEDVPKMSSKAKKKLIEKFGSAGTLKEMFLMHSDLELKYLLTFSIPELIVLSDYKFSIEQALLIFDELSYKFDDLKDFPKDHFILGNPVHSKPFINIQYGVYFSSLYTVMSHLSIGLVEKLVNKNNNLREAYNKYRAKYLEEQIEKMFTDAFPDAQIFKGSMWIGKDNKKYENDLLIIIDSFALIVEAKSGMVSPPAKRGASDRLYKTLQELIEDPSEQAIRFIEYLKDNKTLLKLETKSRNKNLIDASKLKFFIPLGITLSNFGAISTNLKGLKRAGVTMKEIRDLAPSICLTDLEVIFDLLPTVAQKLHYFQRRRELEINIEYIADEMDLLAWYIDCGFNIGKNEYLGNSFYDLTLKSKEIDSYVVGARKGQKLKKPSVAFTTWWKDMLERLDKAKPQLWLENSFILLNLEFSEQILFEKMFNELVVKIKIGKATLRHNWILVDNNHIERRYVIVGYPYTNELRHERDDMIGDIISDQEKLNTKGMLVIGVNIDKEHYPYSVLCSKLSTKLFDSEFSSMVNISDEI